MSLLTRIDLFKTIQLNSISEINDFWNQVTSYYSSEVKTYLLIWNNLILVEIEKISLLNLDRKSIKNFNFGIKNYILSIRDLFLKISNPNNLYLTNIQPICIWNTNSCLEINLIEKNQFTKIVNEDKSNTLFNSSNIYYKYNGFDLIPNWYCSLQYFRNYNITNIYDNIYDNFNVNSCILVITSGAGPKHIITPLIDSCFKGDVRMVQILLRLQANPNICCSDGWSPIMEAAFAYNQNEQDCIDLVALLVLYKALPWPGGQFISCRDGSIMTKLEDIPPINCHKLRLFCVLITLGVPINGDPLTKSIFYQLPQKFENFKKKSSEIAKTVSSPGKPNLFRILPVEITKNILEITFGHNIHLIIKQMISPGILDCF